jgi:hypothetical protein
MGTENSTASFHQQALLTAGFLGGISFTALVLVLQAQAEFTPNAWGWLGALYFLILISLMGSTSAFFVFASVAMTGLAAGRALKKRDDFAFICFVLGFFGVIFSLPFLLLPFNWVAALVVGIIESSTHRRLHRQCDFKLEMIHTLLARITDLLQLIPQRRKRSFNCGQSSVSSLYSLLKRVDSSL